MVKANSWWKIFIKILAIILAFIILLIGSYVLYVILQYKRIEDNLSININNNQIEKVKIAETYSISTYNIGFGAYSQDFSFFMDSGETLDGTKLQGTGSVAKDKETVLKNTQGAINTIKQHDVDFAFFQEVDVEATRSYKVNQFKEIQENFPGYSNSISINFDSAYLLYPLNSPHGKTKAGIVTLSKYNISNAIRRSLPVDDSFPTKFFDLDRCFQLTRLPIDNSEKELVLINIHMSAYDEGGKIRAKQLKMLNEVLKNENELNNYVIVGGDFNHDISILQPNWQTNRKTPEWAVKLNNEDLTEGYRIVSSINAPTCRSTDTAYIKNENYLVVIDGYICSNNVNIVSIENIDTDFLYSDHNPALLNFQLS